MTAIDLAAHYRGRRVLVTGGLGFIGSNLARVLVEHGADVTVIDSLAPGHGGDRRNVAGLELEIAVADVRNRAILEPLMRGREVVFNLVGRTGHVASLDDPLGDLGSNLQAPLAVLETLRETGSRARVVFSSTRQVYGCPRYQPVDEAHPTNPTDVNGVHKLAAERIHLLYGRLHGLGATVLRLANVHGQNMQIDDGGPLLNVWVYNAVAGRELQVFGDGLQRRDLLHVDDAVSALLLAGARTKAAGRVYNVGGGAPVRLVDLAERLVAAAGGGSHRVTPFPAERVVIDVGDFCADDGLIRRELGWEPRVSLDAGLASTLASARERLARGRERAA
ncbi:MAG: NAD-dependent epimerase/dehydratase family protein [Gaiellaceae bacterium]